MGARPHTPSTGIINGAMRGWILCGGQSLCEHVLSDKNNWRLRAQNNQSPHSLHSGVLFFFFLCIIYIAHCIVAALNDQRIEKLTASDACGTDRFFCPIIRVQFRVQNWQVFLPYHSGAAARTGPLPPFRARLKTAGNFRPCLCRYLKILCKNCISPNDKF